MLETANSLCETLKDQEIQQHLCVLPLTLLLENTAGLFANLLNGSLTVHSEPGQGTRIDALFPWPPRARERAQSSKTS